MFRNNEDMEVDEAAEEDEEQDDWEKMKNIAIKKFGEGELIFRRQVQ